MIDSRGEEVKRMTQERFTWDQDFDGVLYYDVYTDAKTGKKYKSTSEPSTLDLLNQQAEAIEAFGKMLDLKLCKPGDVSEGNWYVVREMFRVDVAQCRRDPAGYLVLDGTLFRGNSSEYSIEQLGNSGRIWGPLPQFNLE